MKKLPNYILVESKHLRYLYKRKHKKYQVKYFQLLSINKNDKVWYDFDDNVKGTNILSQPDKLVTFNEVKARGKQGWIVKKVKDKDDLFLEML